MHLSEGCQSCTGNKFSAWCQPCNTSVALVGKSTWWMPHSPGFKRCLLPAGTGSRGVSTLLSRTRPPRSPAGHPRVAPGAPLSPGGTHPPNPAADRPISAPDGNKAAPPLAYLRSSRSRRWTAGWGTAPPALRAGTDSNVSRAPPPRAAPHRPHGRPPHLSCPRRCPPPPRSWRGGAGRRQRRDRRPRRARTRRWCTCSASGASPLRRPPAPTAAAAAPPPLFSPPPPPQAPPPLPETTQRARPPPRPAPSPAPSGRAERLRGALGRCGGERRSGGRRDQAEGGEGCRKWGVFRHESKPRNGHMCVWPPHSSTVEHLQRLTATDRAFPKIWALGSPPKVPPGSPKRTQQYNGLAVWCSPCRGYTTPASTQGQVPVPHLRPLPKSLFPFPSSFLFPSPSLPLPFPRTTSKNHTGIRTAATAEERIEIKEWG